MVKKLHPYDDKGKYDCKTGVMTTHCDVSIRRMFCWRTTLIFETKIISSVLAALRIEKGLKDVDTLEEEEVTFEVTLSKSDARGKWLKDGKVLYPDQK